MLKTAKKVTIVVPVYGDWPSLDGCIESLKKFIDDRHKVIFVNDRGPDHDSIETNIKKSIASHDNFTYHANATNMGFLRNCNNAVLAIDDTDNDIVLLNSDTKVTEGFLDELIEVAYVSNKHGVVCPRSSDATIASIPLNFRNQDTVMEPEESYLIYQMIQDHLPRYTVSPVSVGFCFYIKREVINSMDGLFDEVFGMGYGEEDDFCMRINKKGYVAVIANQAFVYHMSARSFTPERRNEIIQVNAKILEERHPIFNKLVHNYISYYTNFAETFGETIYVNQKPNTGKVKVLIDLHSLPPTDIENSQEIKRALHNINRQDGMEFTVAASRPTLDFLSLEDNYIIQKEPHDVQEQFDIGISLFTVRDMNNLSFVQRTCARWCVFDGAIDFIYNNDHRVESQQSFVAQKSLEFSDVIISFDDRYNDGMYGDKIQRFDKIEDIFTKEAIVEFVKNNPIKISKMNEKWQRINDIRLAHDSSELRNNEAIIPDDSQGGLYEYVKAFIVRGIS